jgi:hypothetical protein
MSFHPFDLAIPSVSKNDWTELKIYSSEDFAATVKSDSAVAYGEGIK